MNIKRMRGRNNRGGGGGGGPPRHQSGNVPLNRNHVFDSNGPDLRIRGTAQQLFEKYLQLGRDATSSGDRVMAEAYFQHAEHYFRIINAINQAQQQSQPHAQGGNGAHVNGGQGSAQAPAHNGPRRDEPEDGDEQPDLAQALQAEQPRSRDIPIGDGSPEG